MIVARRSVLFFEVTQLAIRGCELYPRQFAANTGRTGQKMISTVCITKLQGIGSPRNAHYCHLPEIIKQLPVIIEIHGLHHRAPSTAFLERELLETEIPLSARFMYLLDVCSNGNETTETSIVTRFRKNVNKS